MLAPGTELGKYTIQSLIGGGGFGFVYRATQRGPAGFAQEVALKTVRPSARPDALESLAREARIVARLRHRNIVQVYDFASEGELYFLVMELVEGLTLKELRRRGARRLPLWLKVGIAAEVASGLHYAHAARDDEGHPLGLIHRDIKPSNILLSRLGDVKIADFGLAKLSRVPSDQLTAAGVVKGTPAYMSPEQRAGRPATPATDVYSLAAVLCELCTGVNPTSQAHECMPSLLAQVRPDGPAEQLRAIDSVLEAALSNDLARRPTAAQLGDELRVILAQLAPDPNPTRLSDELASCVKLAAHDAPPPPADAAPATLGIGEAPWGQAVIEQTAEVERQSPSPWSLEHELRQTAPIEPERAPAEGGDPLSTLAAGPRALRDGAATVVAEAAGVPAPAASEGEHVETASAPSAHAARRRRARALVVAGAGALVFCALLLLVLLLVPPQPPEAVGWTDATIGADASRPLAATEPLGYTDASGNVDVDTPRRDRPSHVVVGLKGGVSRHGWHRPVRGVKGSGPIRTRPEPKARPETGEGWLSVNSRPWAIVFIDGRRLATTPVFRHALPAGAHTVQLVTAKQRTAVRNVTIRRDRHLNLGMIELADP